MKTPTVVLVLALFLASCAAVEKAFTKDPATGKSPAEVTTEAASPFLPPPWGTLAVAAISALSAGGVVHAHHKRKTKLAGASAVKPAV